MGLLPIPILVKDGRPSLWRLFPLLGLGFLLAIGVWLFFGLAPAGATGAQAETVEVPYGTGIARIAVLLEERGLVRNPLVFRIWAKLTGGERAVKAGAYALAPDMSVPKILSVLTDGRELTVRVTIPEGATLKEIAAILDRHGISAPETFLARANDPALIREVAPDAEGAGLEGFLFPDTYFLSARAGAEGAIRMMAGRFAEVVTPAMRDKARSMGRSIREIAIMASIVEHEAKRQADRPRIATVFYNRLRLGMPLQSCATVQYALGEHKERLLYEDLQVASPYNTYLRRGLPPGPIGSPGLASLEAALNPAPGRELYFVARPDGSHVFSETYREHLRAQREIERAGNGR